MSDIEEPKRDFSLLLEFPPDIWASIADLLPAEQLGRLKLTGSKSVWQRLRTINTVTRIILGQDFVHFQRWPAFLRDFPSVRELSIMHYNEQWCLDCGARLDLMPSTLRKLTLKLNPTVLPLFFCGEGDKPLYMADHVPLLEYFDLGMEWGQPSGVHPGSDFQRIFTLWDSKLPWLTRLPTSLTSLKVTYWNPKTPLPTSLIHLHVQNVIEYDRLSTTTLEIPPNLESIKCGTLYGADIIIPKLPASIVVLEAGYLNATHNKQYPAWMSIMPKSLITLECDVMHESRSPFGITPNLTLACQSLRELTLNTLPTEHWHCLPQTLCKLVFKNFLITSSTVSRSLSHPLDNTKTTFVTVPIELLPRSITHLDVDVEYSEIILLDSNTDRSESSQSHSEFFPPNLTFFRARNLQFTLDTAIALPPTLTTLEVEYFDNRLYEYLPRGLEQLVSTQTMMTADSVKFLPSSLTSLHLELTSCDYQWIDPYTAEPMDAGQLMVTYPHIYQNSMTCFCEANLAFPQNLKYLYLQGFSLDDHLSSLMPMYLQELNLSDSPSVLTNAFFPSLPRYLTTLYLQIDVEITGECFEDLPRSLTELHLPKCGKVANSAIKHLPQNLQVLGMNEATQLTEICLIDFPRSLESLRLRDTSITRRAFPDLPYKIQSKLNNRPQPVFETMSWCVNGGSIIQKQVKTGPVQGFFKAVSEFITSLNTF